MIADGPGWVTFSAIAQAIAALAIAVMTFFLVRYTGRYVEKMAEANDLQSQANQIASALLARANRSDLPFLVSTSGGGSGSTGGAGEWLLKVQNRGGGLARSIVVETSAGDASIDAIGAGDEATTLLRVSTGYDSTAPTIALFRFDDARGTSWRQRPNELPDETA